MASNKLQAKEALIEAATHLFIEKGYDAVSTRELADAAGVNLGAIQYHFGSKANLFVASMASLMEGSDCQQSKDAISGPISSEEDAGKKLCYYVLGFLDSLLRREGPQPCHLMFREIVAGVSNDAEAFETLISAVVTDFIKPIDDCLLVIIEALDKHKRGAVWIARCAQSIAGQCSFYQSHRPFVERLRGGNLAESPLFEETARHIAEFSMLALGCDEKFIHKILEEAIPLVPAKVG